MASGSTLIRALRATLGALLLTAAFGAPSAAAQGGGDAVIQDCQDGHVDGSYSQADYKQAMRDLPTDIDEYTDCRDQIRAAQLSSAAATKSSSGRSAAAGATATGGSGGSGTGGGAGATSGSAAGGASGAGPGTSSSSSGGAAPATAGAPAGGTAAVPAARAGSAGAQPDATKATPGSAPGGLSVAPATPASPIAPVGATLREASVAPGEVAIGLALLAMLIGATAWLAPRVARRRRA